MNIIVRNEEPKDHRRTEEVAREAFWNLYFPGAAEHYVVHKMRSHPDFIQELAFVIEVDGTVEGAIFYTHSKVVTPDGEFPTISFGPVFISPKYHRQGLGRKLITHSIEIAKEMIRTQAKPKDKSQRMILNNYETIEYLRSNKNVSLSKDFILEIHRRITQGTLDNRVDEGKFRDDNKIVVADSVSGDIVHIPPDCSCIENSIEVLCSFANNDGEVFIHPIIKAIIIHFMFSYLHPFVDGNGRTARSLFYWYMLREGYWLTEFLAISRNIYKTKGQYEKAFIHTELDDGDLGYFINYNLIALQKSFTDLKDYLEWKQKEESALLEFKEIEGINERQAGIIKIYVDKPNSVFTAKELVNSFGVTEKTVRADLEGLVALGFLERIAKNKRLSGYAASPDFNFKLAEIKGK